MKKLTRSEAGKLGAIACKNIKNWLKRQERIVKYYKNPKRCPVCGAPIEYKKRLKNTTCSQSCAATFSNFKKYTHKNTLFIGYDEYIRIKPHCAINNECLNTCLNCGTQISYKSKFCSSKCSCEYKNLKNEKEIQSGCVVSQRRLRAYLLRSTHKCMNPECCWDWSKNKNVVLEVHHIDGDPTNNVLSNVLLLCPNCHSLTDTYKAKNTGNGRAFRRQRYKEGKSF